MHLSIPTQKNEEWFSLPTKVSGVCGVVGIGNIKSDLVLLRGNGLVSLMKIKDIDKSKQPHSDNNPDLLKQCLNDLELVTTKDSEIYSANQQLKNLLFGLNKVLHIVSELVEKKSSSTIECVLTPFTSNFLPLQNRIYIRVILECKMSKPCHFDNNWYLILRFKYVDTITVKTFKLQDNLLQNSTTTYWKWIFEIPLTSCTNHNIIIQPYLSYVQHVNNINVDKMNPTSFCLPIGSEQVFTTLDLVDTNKMDKSSLEKQWDSLELKSLFTSYDEKSSVQIKNFKNPFYDKTRRLISDNMELKISPETWKYFLNHSIPITGQALNTAMKNFIAYLITPLKYDKQKMLSTLHSLEKSLSQGTRNSILFSTPRGDLIKFDLKYNQSNNNEMEVDGLPALELHYISRSQYSSFPYLIRNSILQHLKQIPNYYEEVSKNCKKPVNNMKKEINEKELITKLRQINNKINECERLSKIIHNPESLESTRKFTLETLLELIKFFKNYRECLNREWMF